MHLIFHMQYFTCILFAMVLFNTISIIEKKSIIIEVDNIWNLFALKQICAYFIHISSWKILSFCCQHSCNIIKYDKLPLRDFWAMCVENIQRTIFALCISFVKETSDYKICTFFSQENAVKYWSPYYNITFSCWNNQKLIYMVLFLKNAISHFKL